MKNIFLLMLAVSILFLNPGGKASAADDQAEAVAEPSSETGEEAYVYPKVSPEVRLNGGYRFVDTSGSSRAEEFEYLQDSITFGTEIRMFSFPHRLHLDFNLNNSKDYFGDITYSYEDIVRFRMINSSLFHNLDNIRLIDLDSTTASPGVNVRDADRAYGIKVRNDSVFLRLKTRDFPFHVYLDGNLVEKTGVMQQRTLLGSGSFNNIVRTSQGRDIDWKTKNITVGANSHLGPIEMDISHSEKRFDAGNSGSMYDTYTNLPSSPGEPSAVYPHNVIPELKGSTNTIKLHTSYTGALVASATLSKMDRENQYSGAKADYLIGVGEITWVASPKLVFYLKYRHKESDVDNPDTVSITDRSNPSAISTFAVRPSISSTSDIVSGTVKYRPLSGIILRTSYSYEDIERDNAQAWNLPDSTRRHVVTISADARLLKGVNLRGKYTHKEVDNPAYNTDPDHSDEGKIYLSWIPIPRISTLISYTIAKEKRDDLYFNLGIPADNRRATRDNLLASLTLMVTKEISATASFAYMHTKAEQDLEYHDTTGLAHIDPFVPYSDLGHAYTLDLNYMPKENLSFRAGVNYTLNSGGFSPSDPNLTQPASIASFSDMKTRETLYSVSGEYRFKNGFAAGVQYRYSDFNDVLDNPYDDVNDGKAHIVLVTFSKKW